MATSVSLTLGLHGTRHASLYTASTDAANGLSMHGMHRTKHVARCGHTNAVVRTRSAPLATALRHRRHRARLEGAYSIKCTFLRSRLEPHCN